ncbi:MAG: phosphotransferase [Candidatus Binataceae bacterium]
MQATTPKSASAGLRRRAAVSAVRSALNKEKLAELVSFEYELPSPIACEMFERVTNDLYRVAAGGRTYMLRIYCAGWRTLEDVQYELEVLNHLHRKGFSVSVPVARKNGELAGVLDAVEGPRVFALLTEIATRSPERREDEPLRYGRAVAAIHNATDDFKSAHRRFHLDLKHLLDDPASALRSGVQHRPNDVAYLEQLSERVRRIFLELPFEEMDSGFCHGFPHGVSPPLTADGAIVFRDFDFGGPGWRVYDLATLLYSVSGRQGEQVRNRFLEGYRQVRNLSDPDFRTIPVFAVLAQIWLLGLQYQRFDVRGCSGLTRPVLDSEFGFLRQWSDLLDRSAP